MSVLAANSLASRLRAAVLGLIRTHPSITDPDQQQRSGMIAAVTLAVALFAPIIFVALVMVRADVVDDLDVALYFSLAPLFLIAYVLNRAGRVNLAGALLIVASLIVTIGAPFLPIGTSDQMMFTLLAVLLTGMLFSLRWSLAAVIATLLALAILIQVTPPTMQPKARYADVWLLLFVMQVLLVAFMTQFQWILNASKSRLERANAALQESQALYAAVIEQSIDGVAIVQNRHITVINQAAARMLGYDVRDMIGMPAGQLIAPQFRPQVLADVEARLAGEDVPSLYEIQLVHKDGTLVDVEVTQSLIRFQSGTATLILVRDISERLRTQNLRVDLAKEQERRTTQHRFVSMLVHDVKNPVTALQLSIGLATRMLDRGDVDRARGKLESMQLGIDRITALINDVLQVNQSDDAVELDTAPVDIVELARSVLTEHSTAFAAYPHTFSFDSSIDALKLTADGNLLRRALGNLVSNAVVYSPNGGAVAVIVEATGSHIVLRVRDQGIGIPESDLPHIFEFFRRASNSASIHGTGLGLAIVKQAVERHGGVVDVESTEGVGSCFTIHLPRALAIDSAAAAVV